MNDDRVDVGDLADRVERVEPTNTPLEAPPGAHYDARGPLVGAPGKDWTMDTLGEAETPEEGDPFAVEGTLTMIAAETPEAQARLDELFDELDGEENPA